MAKLVKGHQAKNFTVEGHKNTSHYLYSVVPWIFLCIVRFFHLMHKYIYLQSLSDHKHLPCIKAKKNLTLWPYHIQ